MTTSDNETPIIAAIENERKLLVNALRSIESSFPDENGLRLRQVVRSLVDKALEGSLPLEAASPEKEQDCGEYAALSYTLAAEIIHFYRDRNDTSHLGLGRGLVLDLWDLWWFRASGIQLGKKPHIPSSSVAEGRLGTGLLIDPAIIRSAFMRLDDDIARILECNVDKHLLKRQGIWLLRRLCHARFPLRQRVVLYEFLRLRHWYEVDCSSGIYLPRDSLELLIYAAKESKNSLRHKNKESMPTVSEDVFRSDSSEIEPQERLMLETLQILRSVKIDSDIKINEIGSHLIEVAGKLGIKTGELSGIDINTLLLRLAASSRMIRGLCHDLLGYNFPKPSRSNPQSVSSSAGCDCWISVIGYRGAGKTTFMRSLVAALLPDGSQFNDPEIDWLISRASILNNEDFERSPTYAEIFGPDNSVKTRTTSEMSEWISGECKNNTGTKPSSQTIAEIRTQHMARLRFFDLAGEEFFKDGLGEMDSKIRELLAARKPVATIYIDSEDTRKAEDRGIKFNLAVKHAFTEKGPIYIVFNKADMLLESYKEKKALEELKASIGHEGRWDHPREGDADHDPEATNGSERFFSTRWLKLPETGVATHEDILAGIDELPTILRRPFFHDRLRKDITNVKNLLDNLLINGHRDITFVYLTSACCQRTTQPEHLCGTQEFWNDIENRVLTSTRDDRIAYLRKLLETNLKENLNTVSETYEPFDNLFNDNCNSSNSGANEERLRTLDEVLNKDVQNLKKFVKSVPNRSASDINKLIDQIEKIKEKLKKIERLKVILDECIERFVPELGFRANNKKSEIDITHVDDVSPHVKKIEEHAQTLAITAMKFGDNKRERNLEHLSKGIFGINRGWQGRIGLGAGSHVDNDEISPAMIEVLSRNMVDVILNNDGSLREASSEALEKVTNGSKDVRATMTNDWSFLHGLLAENFEQTEKRVLADAFYNFCHPADAQYPNFIMKRGEQDFYKARVLTGEDQLAKDLYEFREEALFVLDHLLASRHRLNTLRSDAVLNLVSAQEIYGTLKDNRLPSIERLVKDEVAFKSLSDTAVIAGELAEQIRNGSSLSLPSFFQPGRVYVELYRDAGEEKKRFWSRMDPDSWELVSTGKVNRVNAGRIRANGNRLKGLSLLYNLLIRKVDYFRGEEESVFETANEYIKDSTLGLNVDLFQRLSHLRLRRMLLVNVYPFYYLYMTRWVESSIDGKGIGLSLSLDAEQRFKDHPGALQRLYHLGAVAVYNEFQKVGNKILRSTSRKATVTIKNPLGNYKVHWKKAEYERDEFVKLLLDDRTVKDLIWGLRE